MVVAVGTVREAKEPGHQGVKQIPEGTHPSQGNQLSGVQPVHSGAGCFVSSTHSSPHLTHTHTESLVSQRGLGSSKIGRS